MLRYNKSGSANKLQERMVEPKLLSRANTSFKSEPTTKTLSFQEPSSVSSIDEYEQLSHLNFICRLQPQAHIQ